MCPIFNGPMHGRPDLAQRRQTLLVFLTASLASTILIKLGEIQILELVFLADLLLVVGIFFRDRLRARVFNPYFSVAVSYGIFMVAAFLLSAYALQQDFFPYGQMTLLKRPLVMTISRIVELLVDVFYMLYLANLYRKDERLCRLGMKTYYWFGIASAVYSVLSYPLNVMYGWNLGTYYEEHRMRGFYNEGGPYGVYLVSVLLVTAVMRRRGWLTRFQSGLAMGLFVICMVLSQSKSALLLLPVLGLINGYVLLPRRGQWAMIGVAAVVLAVLSFAGMGRVVELYQIASADYRMLSQIRSQDGNYVMGRVAGTVLAPRMIMAHPLTGVGWGNYGAVRDDPQYRQGTAFAIANDAPGLGPIDYIVDLGIPLWLFLMWAEFKPFRLLRRQGAGMLILNLALMQPLANIFGAHLNLTYPWVVAGFALGLGYQKTNERSVSEVAVIA
jgi:O-Antigen ligase